MALYDIYGNKISGATSGKIAPKDTTFFEVLRPKFTNRFDGSYVVGAANDNGGIDSAVTSCATTDYIDISDGAYLYVGTKERYTENPFPDGAVKFGCTWLYMYDEDKNVIGSRYSGMSSPVEIPANAKYTRVTWQPYGGASNIANGTYFVGVVDSADEIAVWEPYYEPGTILKSYIKPENATYKSQSPMDGKTWVLFGDSITEAYAGTDWQGNGFASKIAREFGLTIDNRGKSGSNICSGTNDYPNVTGIIMLDAFLAEIEAGTTAQPDYITIAFGANCWEEYVGTAEDTSANTDKSYYGATKYFIEKLREKCPNSVFGFVLAHEVDWTGVKDTKQVGVPLGREAMKAVCEEYRVPYINMYTESGITADMLSDGVHIGTEHSANLYYHAMRRFMMGL